MHALQRATIAVAVTFLANSPAVQAARVPDIPALPNIPTSSDSSTKQDVPDTPAIPPPESQPGSSQPNIDPRCQGLTDSQRQETPGCH